MSFRPSFRLTTLAAGLLLAVTATAQPVLDQPANATSKGASSHAVRTWFPAALPTWSAVGSAGPEGQPAAR